jgi:hypothetical protein
MPFSPTTFTAGSKLEASEVQENFDDLREYLHAVPQGDLVGPFDTRHVQIPTLDAFTGVQHGVTGHQGGQWGGGFTTRMAFITSYTTGQGYSSSVGDTWAPLPNTAVKLPIRRDARILYHWWVEVEAGPDDLPHVAGRNYASTERLAYVAPYISNVGLVSKQALQTVQNHQVGFAGSAPYGASRCYAVAGAYGQRDGTLAFEASAGEAIVGLAYYSQIDRSAVINWGFTIEAFYL